MIKPILRDAFEEAVDEDDCGGNGEVAAVFAEPAEMVDDLFLETRTSLVV